MLRDQTLPWWRRLLMEPVYVAPERPGERRCPECDAGYDLRQHYCVVCKTALPEWRFG